MAEFDDELDMQRELDTRDSLASMAHYHVCHRRVPLPRRCCRQASFPLRPAAFAL